MNDMFVMTAWRKDILGKADKAGQEKSTVKFGKSLYLHAAGSRY